MLRRILCGSRCVRSGLAAISLQVAFCASASGQVVSAKFPDAPIPTAEAQRAASAVVDDVDISWKKLPKRILADQKDIWLFPTQVARGRYWIPTIAVVGGTAGLIAADPKLAPYFRKHAGNIDDINDGFDGTITSAETALVPLSLLAAGYLRHSPYQVTTSLLAGEAFVDSEIVDVALKAITRRQRPNAIPPSGPFNDTFFKGKSRITDGSFPSGHAIGAFS